MPQQQGRQQHHRNYHRNRSRKLDDLSTIPQRLPWSCYSRTYFHPSWSWSWLILTRHGWWRCFRFSNSTDNDLRGRGRKGIRCSLIAAPGFKAALLTTEKSKAKKNKRDEVFGFRIGWVVSCSTHLSNTVNFPIRDSIRERTESNLSGGTEKVPSVQRTICKELSHEKETMTSNTKVLYGV